MSNLIIGGQFNKKTMTKQELINYLKRRIENLEAVTGGLKRDLVLMNAEVRMNTNHIQGVEYRSLATLKLLLKGKVFTEEVHVNMYENLQIEHHDIMSAADDERTGLVDVAELREIKVGDTVTMRLDSFHPDMIKEFSSQGEKGSKELPVLKPHPNAGKLSETFSILRSKIIIGRGEPHPLIEDKVIGMKLREVKEFTLTSLPKEFGTALSGQDLKFRVEITSHKEQKVDDKTAPANS